MQEAGTEVPIVWNGRRVRAFVPTLLHERDLALDPATAAVVAVAASEVGRAAESVRPELEPLARLLLRAEGVASSYIEGIGAPVVDVVLAETDSGAAPGSAARWVAASFAATNDAVHDAIANAPLDLPTLLRWHRVLMSGSPTPQQFVGRVRELQGWIGGASPLDAHLVTPPPEYLGPLLEDLIAWVNRVDVEPVMQAAIAHAQFEIIHPFADGNGRVGRMLVAWILTRRLALVVPPPVSAAIAEDVGGYAGGLVRFRLGDHLGWIRWFAAAVGNGSRAQRALVARVEQLQSEWHATLAARGVRRDATAHVALELLVGNPVITATVLVDALGVSRKTALEALGQLIELGVLADGGRAPSTGVGQPARVFVAHELLGLVASNPQRA